MAYDEALAARFRAALARRKGISEKKMMGGICFFSHGNMIGGVSRIQDGPGRFMFRVGKENEAEALSREGAAIVEMGGRRMGGFIDVNETDCGDMALKGWIKLALGYVGTLPPK